MVTLTTCVVFFLFSSMHFSVWRLLGKTDGPCVRLLPMKCSEAAESLRNSALVDGKVTCHIL
jgi:hypothetical protein